MTSLYAWSKTAGSNGNSDSAISWPEGQTPGSVNDSARAVMGRVAEFRDDIAGALAVSGTANGLVVTANSGFTTLANGRVVAFRATASNTTAANINVNSTGAKSIRIVTAAGDAALSGGEIQSGGTYVLMYNEALNSASGGWQLINPTLPAFSLAVASRTALKALNTTVYTSAVLMETGYEGLFVFKSGNYSARHTDDAEYTYIKADAIATSSGAWVRVSPMRMPNFTLDEQQDVPSTDPDLIMNQGFPYAWRASKLTVTANANPSSLPTTYTNYVEWAGEVDIYEFEAGFNTDASDHTLGRSGAFRHVSRMYHNGQGDLVGRHTFMLLESKRSGATHFLANPAIIVENGNLGVGTSAGEGGYLNHSEYLYTDSGYDIAVIDRVRNYDRDGDGTTLDQVWIHDRPQSVGTYPIDAAYSLAGKYNVGFDTTPANLGTNKAAIALKAEDRIYLNASSTVDGAGAYWYADTLSNTYIHYSSSNQVVTVVGGIPMLQVKSTDVTVAGDFYVTGDSAWTTSTPTPTATGSFTSVSCSMRYKKLGRMVLVHASLVITTNGTASAYIAIPIPYAAQGVTMLSAAVVAGGFEPIIARTLNSDIILLDATGAYPGADGLTINVSGVYEATS